MDKITAQGWAIIDPDGINIKTVSDTRRAAIVNWLVVERHIIVMERHTDEVIEAEWRRQCGPSEAREVTISV